MAIGRISGLLLQDNLERTDRGGTTKNLAIDTNLAYFDVGNRRFGIGTITPTQALDVPGNVRLANLTILGNTITSNTGKINLGSISNVQITGGSANYILYTDGDGNLSFGNLNVLSGLEGFTGNNIALGSNTAGSIGNAVVFSTSTSVTDAIAQLNQLLGNITDSTGTTIHVSGNISGSNISGTTIISPTIDAINANITAANLAIATLDANVGAYEIWANAYISSIDANIGAYQLYANANATAQAVSIDSLATGANANTAAFLSTFSGNVSGTFNGNIHTDYIIGLTSNVITIGSTGALRVPVGSTTQQPTGAIGDIRFNTDTSVIEFYDGTSWIGVLASIGNQKIDTGDGVNTVFTLNQTTTATAILVTINGTVQDPTTAYGVVGNQITFAQAPLSNDIIDIRFLASAVVNTNNSTIIDAGSHLVGTANTIIDSWNTSNYRSAKYVISSSNGTDATMAEIMLLQNNDVVVLNSFGILNTSSNTINFYANINGTTVNLLAKGTTSSNQIRIQSVYFSI